MAETVEPRRPAAAPPPAPRYGEESLAEVVPSLAAALGLPGFANALGLEPAAAAVAVVLMVDGLGWRAVRQSPEDAPFLAGLAGEGESRALTAGFPATTVTSLSSLGTGLPPGLHGMVAYSFSVSGFDRPINGLRWQLLGSPPVDLLEEVVPEEIQPRPTAFERAAGAGARVFACGPRDHARSGLTRAVLRGGRYVSVHSMGDLAGTVAELCHEGSRTLVYAYYPNLDLTMHIRGAASDSAAAELAQVDRMAEQLADRLPSGALMVVTGDHGLHDIDQELRVDVADEPGLLEGVRMLAGEPRCRFVYARPGAEADVLAAWRERVGDRMRVLTRDEAVAAGWFGPTVLDAVRPRIGEVIAVARAGAAVFHRDVEGPFARMVAHHGALTEDEALVPLLVARR